MKKKLSVFTVLIILPLILQANFIGLNQGSKPMAMGGAYTALANDPTAVFWNPAGLAYLNYDGVENYEPNKDLNHWILANIDHYELILSHQSLFNVKDLYNEMAAITFPLYYFRGGIGWRQVNLLHNYYEQVINFSLGYALNFQKEKQLRIGVSLKNMAAVVTKNYPEAENPSTEIFGMKIPGKFDTDIGVQYSHNSHITLGFLAENILEPKFKFVSEAEKVARNFRLGATYNWRGNANFVLDYEWNADRSNWHVGGELWFFDIFAPRIGMNGEDLTIGFGIKTKKWVFDGAVLTNKNLGSTYRISFGLIFEK